MRGSDPSVVASVAGVPIDPSRLNAVGDLVLTETEELRALAEPVRLDLFDLVRRDGPIGVEDACGRRERGRVEAIHDLPAVRLEGQVQPAGSASYGRSRRARPPRTAITVPLIRSTNGSRTAAENGRLASTSRTRMATWSKSSLTKGAHKLTRGLMSPERHLTSR
jgi:hypothetical protein